jgi:predicted short-subunit dehydrogenase-like oxidoreductase (DUF2520 family)
MSGEAVTAYGMDLEASITLPTPSRYLVRELDRKPSGPLPRRVAIVGAGRLGHALAAALSAAGPEVDGPLGRGADPRDADVVLLTVPDGEIANAAAAVTPGPLVGHCSGATGLGPLAPHEALGLHPLITVPAAGARLAPGEVAPPGVAPPGGAPSPFAGAGAAVAGTTSRALDTARALAIALGMRPVEIADEDRAAYHAAASIAANFLVALEGAAERLAATAGVDRELLVPLARAALENWAALGAGEALTGPVARGDEETIARQRAAVAERTPDLLDTFDALVGASRVVAVAR